MCHHIFTVIPCSINPFTCCLPMDPVDAFPISVTLSHHLLFVCWDDLWTRALLFLVICAISIFRVSSCLVNTVPASQTDRELKGILGAVSPATYDTFCTFLCNFANTFEQLTFQMKKLIFMHEISTYLFSIFRISQLKAIIKVRPISGNGKPATQQTTWLVRFVNLLASSVIVYIRRNVFILFLWGRHSKSPSNYPYIRFQVIFTIKIKLRIFPLTYANLHINDENAETILKIQSPQNCFRRLRTPRMIVRTRFIKSQHAY